MGSSIDPVVLEVVGTVDAKHVGTLLGERAADDRPAMACVRLNTRISSSGRFAGANGTGRPSPIFLTAITGSFAR
jgi:hypothetical protein